MTDNNEDLKGRIVDFISKRQGVTCVELSNAFGKGDSEIDIRPNVMIAFGLSEDLAKALIDLENAGQIVLLPAQVLIYMIDGAVPNLPIAKRSIDYKTMHWLPVTYDTYDFGVAEMKRLTKGKAAKNALKTFLVELERRRTPDGAGV